MKIGIIIGRFQSPYLHEGHIGLIKYAIGKSEKVAIFLGCSDARLSVSDPLPYEARREMILDSFPGISVHRIDDAKYDSVWSDNLDRMIELEYPSCEIVLYGGRDSFARYYHGKHRVEDFTEIESFSATKIRSSIHGLIGRSAEWRQGMIYASASRYPVSYQTVDVAIVDSHKKMVLMGRKIGEPKYRFVGGFVDPADQSLERAAKREALEECGDIETDDYRYIGSFRINDWRYKNSQDKIMTAFFCCQYIFGRVNPQDDISELKWFDYSISMDDVEPEHHEMLRALGNSVFSKK